MNVTVNDKTVSLTEGATLADALAAKSIEPKGIATALNGKVVPALMRDSTRVSEGDKIVVIKAFYGG